MYRETQPVVEILADTLSLAGSRITTFKLRYWRFIHSELMTHRVFSRNASSSRAIPAKKMLQRVWDDPAVPVYWGENQPGMQASFELSGWRLTLARRFWILASKLSVILCWLFMKIGLHKQIANRITEPFQWIDVIVTSTEWENFFRLRDHADAQPEFKRLASLMRIALTSSSPVRRDFHIPWCDAELHPNGTPDESHIISSIARVARVSYLNHEGKNDYVKDVQLYNSLLDSQHMSPFEHVAFALDSKDSWCANFRGWKSHRVSVDIYNKESVIKGDA